MNISLTSELEQLIAAKVASGYYHSSSEVVREGLRLLAERDELRQKRIEMLNKDIQDGIDSANAGDLIDGDDAYAQIMQEHEQYE
jgi:antitoxin ParD1/3/4